MRAITVTTPGGVEQLQLQQLPDPEITQPHQLLVELHAAGVNPVDTKLRQNGFYLADHPRHIPGCDGAGIVRAIGSSCSRFQPGDAIFFFNGGLGGLDGNYAEWVVVDERYAVRKPDRLDFATAAATPLALITAWEALFDRASLQQGDEVLIHAGAGGVGHLAIQLAVAIGARVITTVSSPQKAERVLTLGADRAIRYDQEDFVTAVAAWSERGGVDVVLDTVGGEVFTRSLQTPRPYGELVTLLQIPKGVEWKGARLKNLRISQELMLSPLYYGLTDMRLHQTEILQHGGELIESGSVNVDVTHRFPLEQAAEAHRLIEAGGMSGKIVLDLR